MCEQAFNALGLAMSASERARLWMGRDANEIGGGLVLADEYNVVLGPFAHGDPKSLGVEGHTILRCTPFEARIWWVAVDQAPMGMVRAVVATVECGLLERLASCQSVIIVFSRSRDVVDSPTFSVIKLGEPTKELTVKAICDGRSCLPQ